MTTDEAAGHTHENWMRAAHTRIDTLVYGAAEPRAAVRTVMRALDHPTHGPEPTQTGLPQHAPVSTLNALT